MGSSRDPPQTWPETQSFSERMAGGVATFTAKLLQVHLAMSWLDGLDKARVAERATPRDVYRISGSRHMHFQTYS